MIYDESCLKLGFKVSLFLPLRFRLPSLLTDVCVVFRTFQLPVLEPLTPARLHKMVGVAMACLHVALAVTSAVDNFAPGASSAPKAGQDHRRSLACKLTYPRRRCYCKPDVTNSLLERNFLPRIVSTYVKRGSSKLIFLFGSFGSKIQIRSGSPRPSYFGR